MALSLSIKILKQTNSQFDLPDVDEDNSEYMYYTTSNFTHETFDSSRADSSLPKMSRFPATFFSKITDYTHPITQYSILFFSIKWNLNT